MVTTSVFQGELKSGAGDVGHNALYRGILAAEGDTEVAATGTNVRYPHLSPRRDQLLAYVKEKLRLRTRNQHLGPHLEFATVKLPMPREIGNRFALAPPSNELQKCPRYFLLELQLGSYQKIQASHSGRMGEEHLGG
jgi:hypothetical protein